MVPGMKTFLPAPNSVNDAALNPVPQQTIIRSGIKRLHYTALITKKILHHLIYTIPSL